MILNRVNRILASAVVALSVCGAGCFLGKKNAAQNTTPAPAQGGSGDKPAVFGMFPVAQRMVGEKELHDLALFYQTAALAGQPPRSLEELDIKVQAPKLYQAIADKRIIVYWKASPNNAPAGAANTVLAYDADVATKKSAVLMLDGSVTTMTPDEFNQAPKGGS